MSRNRFREKQRQEIDNGNLTPDIDFIIPTFELCVCFAIGAIAGLYSFIPRGHVECCKSASLFLLARMLMICSPRLGGHFIDGGKIGVKLCFVGAIACVLVLACIFCH